MPAGFDERAMPLDVVETVDPGSATTPGSVETHGERVGQLFHRYHGKLVKFLAARTASWEDARELASQTFEHVLSQSAPRHIEYVGAYLYQTARNLAIDQVKHRAMQRRKHPLLQYERGDASPSPEPEHLEAERRDVLLRAVERLPSRLRMALTWRIYDELSDADIVTQFAAQGVQLTERTVRRYLASAYEQLRLDVLAAEQPPSESVA